MATVSKVANLKRQVIIKFGRFEMCVARYKDQPTPEHKLDYWQASDELEDKLSEYYAASIMFMTVHRPDLAEVYTGLSKQEVTDRMLNRIVKKKNFAISQQYKEKTTDVLEQQIAMLKKAKKPVHPKLLQQLNELKKI